MARPKGSKDSYKRARRSDLSEERWFIGLDPEIGRAIAVLAQRDGISIREWTEKALRVSVAVSESII